MSTEEADPVLLTLISDHRSQQVPAEHHTPLPSGDQGTAFTLECYHQTTTTKYCHTELSSLTITAD